MTARNRILLGIATGTLGLFAVLSLLRSKSGSAASSSSSPHSTKSDGEVALRLEEPENLPPARGEEPVPDVSASEVEPPARTPSDPIALPETTIAEMEFTAEALRVALGERSAPILAQRFDDNLSEYLGNKTSYSVTQRDLDEICSIKNHTDGRQYRTSLPRSDYPELYELKDAITRLDKQVGRLRIEAELAKKKD